MTKTNTATGSFVVGLDHRHHKIVADVITEMTPGEKTARPLPPADILPVADIGCRVYRTSTQSIPNAAWTSLAFDSERYDTDGMHALSGNTGRITFKTAGKYIVGGNTQFVKHATGRRDVAIINQALNHIALQALMPVTVIINSTFSIATMYSFAVNDWIELKVYQTSGGNLNIQNNLEFSCEFWAQKIS